MNLIKKDQFEKFVSRNSFNSISFNPLQQSADAGFIEFACNILHDPSYLESLKKCYRIDTPEETMQSDDFNNYQVWII